MYTLVGDLPRHQYVFVDSAFTHESPVGFIPAVWFGLVSYPGRVWGCNVLLESGAIYRNLPPHALYFSGNQSTPWDVKDCQHWDCYGYQFSCIEYKYLAGLDVVVRANKKELHGSYLFTVAPIGDGFSAYPEQAKEFSFIHLDNDRITVQPTNHLLFKEKSFTRNAQMIFPTDIKRQTEVWSCE